DAVAVASKLYVTTSSYGADRLMLETMAYMVKVRSGNVIRSQALGWPPVASGLATCLVRETKSAAPAPEAFTVPSPLIEAVWKVARFSRSAPIESSAVASVESHSSV